MTERIVDISEEPSSLRIELGQLIIARQNEKSSVPLADIAVLLVSNPCVTFTQAVLSGLAENGGVFISCDSKHLPVGMMLPLQGNYVQAERFRMQAEASKPTRKRMWQQIVRAKIKAQAVTLEQFRDNDHGLKAMVSKVRSGDPDNVEGQAARRYWPALFGSVDFQRDPDAGGPNAYLNYGYAVLRAIVARAVCAAGLHPSLGLHHHNRYDAFCLADDLMEPFRPLVDRAVVEWMREGKKCEELDPEAKQHLLEALTIRLDFEGESRTLFDVSSRVASGVVQILQGERRKLRLPQI